MPAATTGDGESARLFRLALLNCGALWPLAAEAAASVAMSRADEVGTYSLEEDVTTVGDTNPRPRGGGLS